MHPLRVLALVMCLVPVISVSQVLDPNFTSPVPLARPEISIVKTQPDGKILLGGYFDLYDNESYHTLIRLNPDGTVDGSFHFPLAAPDLAISQIELKDDGQIIVHNDLQVYILGSSGQILGTFEKVGAMEYIRVIKLQPDGKTLVAGYAIPGGDFLRRHNSDGSVDNTFAFGTSVYISNIELQNDMIILSANYGSFMRLDHQGEIDNSFNPGPYNGYLLNMTWNLDGIAV